MIPFHAQSRHRLDAARPAQEEHIERQSLREASLLRWLLPASTLIALIGYFGPWIPHRAAGLVVLGLDLAEYVKFLAPVRSGEIQIWREGFYLPLVAVSLSLSLYAFRQELRYPWPLRVLLLIGSTVTALNLLPPAWSPALLLSPEFRLQTLALITCLFSAAFSPFLALLPYWLAAMLTMVLSLAGLWLPVSAFLRILPAISQVYDTPLAPGRGIWIMIAGLAILICTVGGVLWQAVSERPLPNHERSDTGL